MARRSRQAALEHDGAPRIMAASDDAAHHGASVTRRDVAAWLPPRRSADAEILRDLPMMVGRSRDLDRNSGVAGSGFRTVLDNVLGAGLRLNPRPDYLALGKSKSWADGVAREWRAMWDRYYWTTACHAGDSLTGDQVTAQVFRSAMANGDAIGLPMWVPGRDEWSTKIQTVESDRLSNPTGVLETREFRGGIKFDAYGAPIAYAIEKTHPGDSTLAFGGGMREWEVIPRKYANGRLRVLHVFDSERSGQSRGKPLLASVLPQFKNVDRYAQAELQAALVNSLIAAFITTPVSPDELSDWFAKDRAEYLKARDEHAVRLDSGMLATLFPGDKIESFMPSRPAAAFDAYMTSEFRRIALAYDLSYEMLIKDWSRLNYVTSRAMAAEVGRSFQRRRDWIATTWMDPWYALWFEEAVNARKIDAPSYYDMPAAWTRCRWTGPGRAILDPVKEATAAQMRIDAGLSTLEIECAELGLDWREVADQRAAEIEYARMLGLPDHSMIRAANPPRSDDRDADPNDRAPADDEPARDDKRAKSRATG